MELSEPASILNQQEQHNHDHQSDVLGFQDDHPTIDQFQALSVQSEGEEEGDCNRVKEGVLEESENEENIKWDGDGQESWRSDVIGGHQSDEKQHANGEVVDQEREGGNEDVMANGDWDRDGNGIEKGRDVQLGAGALAGRRGKSRANQYPVRPEAEDCPFYLRTGACKFGMNCKFNHPPQRKPLPVRLKEKAKDESSEKAAQTFCKYYDRPGGCKYGEACRYSHSKRFELNFLGLPIRPGEKECSYYTRNGSCKYGSSCRFTHPDPANSERSSTLPFYNNGTVASQGGPRSPLAPWSPPAAMSDTASYMPLLFPPMQGIPSSPEWNSYLAPFFPSERSIHIPPAYVVNSLMLEANVYTKGQQMPVDEFPERPGQPECSFYLKTGDCKYKSACKFHHPKNRVSKTPSCTLSDLGLPLRPGQSICSHYSRYGICKFGPACKYDHPENYAHSETSATSDPEQSPSQGNSVNSDDGSGVGS